MVTVASAREMHQALQDRLSHPQGVLKVTSGGHAPNPERTALLPASNRYIVEEKLRFSAALSFLCRS